MLGDIPGSGTTTYMTEQWGLMSRITVPAPVSVVTTTMGTTLTATTSPIHIKITTPSISPFSVSTSILEKLSNDGNRVRQLPPPRPR